MNHLRSKIPAVPGSGFVSTCTTLIQPNDIIPVVDDDGNSSLKDIRKRRSYVTLRTCRVYSKFSKLCPACLHQFNSLIEKYQCLKCARTVCRNCAHKISLTNSDILCKECWDIAKYVCKTGDWFNHYTETKEPCPLKIDVKFKPLENNLHKAKSEGILPLTDSPKNIVNPSFKPNNENEKRSSNQKSVEEISPVKSQQTSRSKSLQTLKSQNSWDYIKSHSQSTLRTKLSGFLKPSTLSHSQSFDYLSRTSDSSRDHEEFEEKSKIEKRLLRLKRLLKKSILNKSNYYKTFNGTDESVHGEIDVSMEYDAEDQQLGVTLWTAKKLKHEKYKIGLPHATIVLLPDNVKYKLEVPGHNKWDGTNAVFDLSVCFTVHECDLKKKIILVKLWSRKGIKSQFTIGQSVIPMEECNLLLSAYRQSFRLLNENNSIITHPNMNTAYYGEIKLALRFAISDYQKKMLCVADKAIDLIGILDVWIKEGKNLHSQNAGTEINSYVTVELTDAKHKTECQTTDQILRSNQPIWNSLLKFPDKYLSELIESTIKIFIWNRSTSLSDPNLLGTVQICNEEKESAQVNMGSDSDMNSHLNHANKLWESVLFKPGDWVEALLYIEAPQLD
ncbi:unnamed protein product [Schistosoma turkestanicum]|nr:unnamed protein product [Schistosoma turkestanicum]